MAPPRADAVAPGGSLAFLRRTGGVLLCLSRPIALVPLLSWAALIWYLSSQPPRAAADHVTVRSLLGNCAHAVEFGVFALLAALTLPRSAGWPVFNRRAVTVVLALSAAYATLDELHQGSTPGRNAAVSDVLTDLVGAACTLWIAAYAARPDASEAGLVRRFGLVLLACFASGGVATLASALFPDVVWL